MPDVHLTSSDLQRLTTAQRALLSPLDHPDVRDWQRVANEALCAALGTDRAVFSFPGPNMDLGMVTEGVDNAFPERFSSYIAGVRGGNLLFRDPVVEKAAWLRRRHGPGAFDFRDLDPDNEAESSPAYQEIFRPAGLVHMVGLSVPLAVGEVTQFFAFDGSDGLRPGGTVMARLRVISAAFVAGVRMRINLERRRGLLVGMLDRLPRALALYGVSGRRLHVNPAWKAMQESPGGRMLSSAAEAFVRPHAKALGATTISQPSSSRSPLAHPEVTLRLGVRPIRLTATYLDAAMTGRGPAILLEAAAEQRAASVEGAARAAGLSPRRAEVAAMMATGCTDKSIARTLGISLSTARNHAAAVRHELGVRSRTAVAAILHRNMAGGSPPSPVARPPRGD